MQVSYFEILHVRIDAWEVVEKLVFNILTIICRALLKDVLYVLYFIN